MEKVSRKTFYGKKLVKRFIVPAKLSPKPDLNSELRSGFGECFANVRPKLSPKPDLKSELRSGFGESLAPQVGCEVRGWTLTSESCYRTDPGPSPTHSSAGHVP